MEEQIQQDVLEILESWGVSYVPINGMLIRGVTDSTNTHMTLCVHCGKPSHGTAGCADGIIIDQSCRGLQF